MNTILEGFRSRFRSALKVMNEPDERFLVGVDGLIWQRAVRKKRCKPAASWFDSKIPFDVSDFGEFGHKGLVILEENVAITEEK